MFKQLKDIDLIEERSPCVAFNGKITQIMGYVELPLYINGHLCSHKFFVVDVPARNTYVVLGTTWKRRYKAYLYWPEDTMYFHAEGGVTKIHFADEEPYSSDEEEEALTMSVSDTLLVQPQPTLVIQLSELAHANTRSQESYPQLVTYEDFSALTRIFISR